ncbi:MAG: hypothetical protein KUA35_10230 [Pseudodesulfovibrio sp.]|uniref:Bacteriophage protein n=2 Tax=Desulfovibrionaceae TaxID=194924 RepID=E6VUA1_PSEA9|nr:hypothetical protein Daes_2403 [Pseudodesulfovibrio aespoeensis Aspo-2]MBU4191341.1 hypothetical protein [Pseudomonadota bacterium]MBV1766477.1 hypothetical protein [Pseudodesulfovibrio sp.]MCG2732512.1 hypothetical protein [Pseudodesulfovibrio aespoeensis]MBU4243455.1 hypothetical protein [Pseudomonadota bacterium]
MALSADRNTVSREGVEFQFPVAASGRIYAGGMVALDTDGNAVPASADATLTVVGRAESSADNSSGNAGDMAVTVRRGCFHYGNSAGADEITRADIGSTAYVVDDETVAKTDDTASRPAAGIIMDVDDSGVWVRI